MARILDTSIYNLVVAPKLDDYVIGTDSVDSLRTKNFKIRELRELILEGTTVELVLDAVPTDGSLNPVESNGIFDSLAGKASLGFGQVNTYLSSNIFQIQPVFERALELRSNGWTNSVGSLGLGSSGEDTLFLRKGSTGRSTQLRFTLATADRIYTWPDKDGTVAMTSDIVAGGQVNSIVAGSNISINSTDPINPIVSATNVVDTTSNQYSIAGEKTFTGAVQLFNGRVGVQTPVFGGSRLGDSTFQTLSIDTQSINIKDTGQKTAMAMFATPVGGSDGYTMTMKNFVDDVFVWSINGIGNATYGGVSREVEATIGLRNDFVGGQFTVLDMFNQDYDAATAVADSQGWVSIHGGGATAKEIGLWRYDTTTYTPIWTLSPTNLWTFGAGVNVIFNGSDVTYHYKGAIMGDGLASSALNNTVKFTNVTNPATLQSASFSGIGMTNNDIYWHQAGANSEWFTKLATSNTAARTHTLQDKSGTLAHLSDTGFQYLAQSITQTVITGTQTRHVLHTVTVPADTVASAGDTLKIRIHGTGGNSSGAAQLFFKTSDSTINTQIFNVANTSSLFFIDIYIRVRSVTQMVYTSETHYTTTKNIFENIFTDTNVAQDFIFNLETTLTTGTGTMTIEGYTVEVINA